MDCFCTKKSRECSEDRDTNNFLIEVKLDEFMAKHVNLRGNLGALLLRATQDKKPRNWLNFNEYFPVNDDIVSVLVERGADVDFSSETGWSSLHYAAHNGNSNIASILLSKNANVNPVTSSGATPLYFAAKKGRFDIVKMLVNSGADPTYGNTQGCIKAKAIALRNGFPNIAKYLEMAENNWIANIPPIVQANMKIESDWYTYRKRLNVIPSKENLSSPIFKLDIVCFGSVFEWVSVNDLFNLRKTCKRMKQVVDDIIRLDYPGWPRKVDFVKRSYINAYVQFYDQANTVHFHKTIVPIDNIQDIGHRIQNVVLKNCRSICGEQLFKWILKYCDNMRQLQIHSSPPSYDMTNVDFLLDTYPKLEHFSLHFPDFKHPTELCEFFNLNPTIRVFSTSVELISENIDCFEQTTHRLDLLNIFIHDIFSSDIEILNELYERGFYKRLRYNLYRRVTDDYQIALVLSLPGIENIRLDFDGIETEENMEIDLPMMPHIKELGIMHLNRNINWEFFVQYLVNVERVHLEEDSDCLVPIVLQFPAVKQIMVDWPMRRKCSYRGRIYMNANVIDLQALNEERSKLANACRVTIYVCDQIYIATKWASPSMALRFVEVKRNEAYDREYDFDASV